MKLLDNIKNKLKRGKLAATNYNVSGAYKGAHDSPYRNSFYNIRSYAVDEDTANRYSKDKLRADARDLYRNNAIVHAAIKRLCEYSVNTGITPQATTTDAEWNQKAENYFNSWALYCDNRSRANLWQLQEQAVTALFVDGAIGFVLLSSGRIQPIEATRIATPDTKKEEPNVIDGMRIDKQGRVIGYYICPRKSNGFVDTSSFEYVRAEDFLYLANVYRPDQLTGIPLIAPVIPALRDLGETDESMLLKVKNEAQQTFKVKKESGGLANERGRFDTATDTTERTVEREGNLILWNLAPNEDVEAIGNVSPNGGYVDYMQFELKTISACLGLPIEFLLLSFEASYSASRASIITAEQTFRRLNRVIAERMNQRLWNWVIAKAIKEGSLPPAPLDERGLSQWYKAEWSLPHHNWIDPQAEATANVTRWNMGLDSLKSIAANEGGDRDDKLSGKKDDIIKAIQISQEIEATTGIAIPWQTIIYTQLAGSAPQPVAQESKQIKEQRKT